MGAYVKGEPTGESRKKLRWLAIFGVIERQRNP